MGGENETSSFLSPSLQFPSPPTPSTPAPPRLRSKCSLITALLISTPLLRWERARAREKGEGERERESTRGGGGREIDFYATPLWVWRVVYTHDTHNPHKHTHTDLRVHTALGTAMELSQAEFATRGAHVQG